MRSLTSTQADTLARLKIFGLAPASGSIRGAGAGILFAFARPHEAHGILANRRMFARGPLGILHSRQVGGIITEYRSYRAGSSPSLHVVLGKGGTFADLDRFNPYQGPGSLFLHGALELAPHLARRFFAFFSFRSVRISFSQTSRSIMPR